MLAVVIGQGFKPLRVCFRLNTRKKFFTMGLVKHRNRFPREVDAPSLKTFKVSLDRVLHNLI